jgi:hypothetical protein
MSLLMAADAQPLHVGNKILAVTPEDRKDEARASMRPVAVGEFAILLGR